MSVTKEAIVIVLNVGQTTQSNRKKNQTVLENAKNCINLIIQRKIFSESKDEIALVFLGSKITANNLAEQSDAEYMNIEVAQEFKTANWEFLELVDKIKSTDIVCDSIKDNALLVAVDLLVNTNSKKFFSRRILFLSDFTDLFSGDQVERICDELKACKIELNIIGPRSLEEEIDNENGTNSYSHLDQQEKGSKHVLKSILKEVNGECYSFSDAFSALMYFQKKKVQALPWNANLELGINLTIPISAYTKVNESKPKSWKTAYARKLNAKIEKNVTYMMNDTNQTKVSSDDTVPAFKYGTTLVPFTTDDKQNMDYQSGEKGMKILGFTKAENAHRHHFIGDKSVYVFGQKNRELAGVILAPFIYALYETKMVAIVRYVYSARSAPKIGFLSPKIKSSYECLIFIPLPFMEDLRHYVFSPLDSNPKNLPTEEQLNVMDELISSMDLSTASVDDEGNLSEYLKPKETFNPYFQRLYQCLQYRGLHPDKPLPKIPAHIEALLNPHPKLLKMAEPVVDKIKRIFPLKIIEQKKRKDGPSATSEEDPVAEKAGGSRKRRRANHHEAYDVKVVQQLLKNNEIKKVGSIQPVQDFKYLVKRDLLPFGEASKQIILVVNEFLKSDNLKHYHSKIVNICKELREASLKKISVIQFNDFMKDLKEELLTKDLDLWNKIRSENIGLLSSTEVTSSAVSPDEAITFLSVSESQTKSSQSAPEAYDDEEDDYDLLDQL